MANHPLSTLPRVIRSSECVAADDYASWASQTDSSFAENPEDALIHRVDSSRRAPAIPSLIERQMSWTSPKTLRKVARLIERREERRFATEMRKLELAAKVVVPVPASAPVVAPKPATQRPERILKVRGTVEWRPGSKSIAAPKPVAKPVVAFAPKAVAAPAPKPAPTSAKAPVGKQGR